jgi:heme A synthase
VSTALLHDRLATTAAFYAFALAVWAGFLAFRNRGLDGNYLGAVVIGEGLLVCEAALGAWLLFGMGLSPDRAIHFLYGTLALLIWPFLFTYTRSATGSRDAVLFSAGSLFLWGLLLRAATTAVPH